MPQISVIMLTYNRAEFIKTAIEGILNQTFQDFEFIIVDNASIDQSGTIAKKYEQQDLRVKVITNHCSNIGSGRNLGLRISSGNYILFVDDDDYFEEDMLAFLYMHAEVYQADIAVCGSYKVEKGKIYPNIVYQEVYIMNKWEATYAYLRRRLYNAGLPTKLIRRCLFDNISFLEDVKYEDIRVMYKLFSKAEIVIAHGLPKYYAVRHLANNSNAATNHEQLEPLQLKEYLQAFKERTQYIGYNLPELHDVAVYSEHSYMISMVEKIYRYNLINCENVLLLMKKVLLLHYEEFISAPYTTKKEKEWMERYIKNSNFAGK